MRRATVLGVACLLVAAGTVLANLAGPIRPFQTAPAPPQPVTLKFTIEIDHKATEARLLVPASAMQAGAPAFNFPGNGGFNQFPAQPDPGPGRRSGSLPPLSTILVGLCLTLSLATGGVWLVRRDAGRAGQGVVPFVVLVGVLGVAMLGTAIVRANAPAPRALFPPPPPVQVPLNLPIVARMDGVRVEVIPQGDAVRLIVPAGKTDEFFKKVKGK
jgi:hypothetical protein